MAVHVNKFFDVTVAGTKEIRVSADLFPEEQRHGAVLRGFSPTEAREMAKLLNDAADVSEELGWADPLPWWETGVKIRP